MRHVEIHGRNTKDPWSFRNFAVYHRYCFSSKSSVWILVRLPEAIQQHLEHVISTGNSDSKFNPMTWHLHYITACGRNWRWYINYLGEQLSELVGLIVQHCWWHLSFWLRMLIPRLSYFPVKCSLFLEHSMFGGPKGLSDGFLRMSKVGKAAVEIGENSCNSQIKFTRSPCPLQPCLSARGSRRYFTSRIPASEPTTDLFIARTRAPGQDAIEVDG